MEYTKIRLDYEYGPKNRFYRIVLIKGNPDLLKLGALFATALGAEFEHCFLFRCKDETQYVMTSFMVSPLPTYKLMMKYCLSDLPNKFSFEYDTGDCWDFKCEKFEEKVTMKSTKDIILLEGAGQGIWEDNSSTLQAYFNGEIPMDFDGEDEEKGIMKPWNFAIDKYSDFDLPLDIKNENKYLNVDAKANYTNLVENEYECANEYDVSIDEKEDEDASKERLRFAIFQAVDEQIRELPYVKDCYKKLSKVIGKKLVAFGDSVTAEATIGCPKTYINLFCEKYQIGNFNNYAIGGTTATYMFKGSNIEKEYTQPDKLFAVDGCRVVNEAVDKGETKDASIAFIAYSHNDMFFQVPIDNKQVVDDQLSLKNCNSFKASYRYMVNKLRSNNPNIIIILINSTYSEYDKNAELIYGNKYSYSDYRKAIKEISEELNCVCIEPWEYMKPYFDYGNKSFYYKDFVHPSVEGQKILFDFIDKEIEQKLF